MEIDNLQACVLQDMSSKILTWKDWCGQYGIGYVYTFAAVPVVCVEFMVLYILQIFTFSLTVQVLLYILAGVLPIGLVCLAFWEQARDHSRFHPDVPKMPWHWKALYITISGLYGLVAYETVLQIGYIFTDHPPIWVAASIGHGVFGFCVEVYRQAYYSVQVVQE